jgi:cell division protein FtsQ
MARKNGPTILQEELYPHTDEPVREELDDSRMLDLDAEQESPFLRGQKRVSVRRGSLPKKTATRLTWTAFAVAIAFVCVLVVAALYHYGERSWRFRVESSDQIETTGIQNVTRQQVMEVMGGDIGRNIFFVPLAERKKQIEQIPWVESASVMRFVPNRLQISIRERTPVAFARVGSKILLTDASGALMDLPGNGKKKYSFPVILGVNPGEPSSTRSARMAIYNQLIAELDSGGAHYSQELSEVDLSDPEDVKVIAGNPQGEVLVHLGSSHYLDRYKIYVAHAQEWRQQFDKLESVDLRYDRQIIVNPDLGGAVKQPPVSFSSARAAMAAGVKPAALVSHDLPHSKAAPSVAKSSAGARSSSKPASGAPSKPKANSRADSAWAHRTTAKPVHHASRRIVEKRRAPAKKSSSAAGDHKHHLESKPSPSVAKGREKR